MFIAEDDGTVSGIDYTSGDTIIYKNSSWVKTGGGGGGGGGMEYWTPELTATTSPLVYKTDEAWSVGSGTVTFSNGNKTVNEDTNGAIAFADVQVNNPNKMGVYFKYTQF
jgi:hypothetical protein